MLSKMEIEILKVLKLNPRLFIGQQELHGYFKFCKLDNIREALFNLLENGCIEAFQKPAYGYFITDKGKHQLSELRKQRTKTAWAVFATVLGLIFAAISAWSDLF
ncbi:hypothetical protein [Clostridium sp. KNHs216]|uniref:hypothetical protein n=1 Tax=Clostridium sp. KNHs216 TaxID=1550235 RepID=UPI00115232EC|nr:hypothetical protein [Clostridium sp. KNHs216]